MARAVVNDTLELGREQAESEGANVRKMPTYLLVTQKQMAKRGVIDLKPFFATSSKRKYNKHGEWYMYIPIAVKRRNIPRKAYEELKSTPMPSSGSTTTYSPLLYGNRNSTSTSNPSVNYTPKSHNVTIYKRQWGAGTRNQYIAFRTVNAKSPASSWIINRKNLDKDELSPTLIANIDRLMKYKLRNL